MNISLFIYVCDVLHSYVYIYKYIKFIPEITETTNTHT